MMELPMKIDLEYVTDRQNKDGTVRYYFRRRGLPLTRLPGDYRTPEFMVKYNECLTMTAVDDAVERGSFAWACDQYLGDMSFTSKAENTRVARARIIRHMISEPLRHTGKETFGMIPVAKFAPEHVKVLRDRKADKINAAAERVKILSQIFKVDSVAKLVPVSPVAGVSRPRSKSNGHETARDEHIEAYERFHTTGPAKVAIALLKEFGVRVSDLRVLGPQHIKNGCLEFRTVKTGVECILPIPRQMMPMLTSTGQMAFLLNDWGRPYKSDKSLSQRVAKWFRQAGVEEITAHSVRKWLATRMANNGATEQQLVAYFGWSDPKEARPYTHSVNKAKLAADAARSVTRVETLHPIDGNV